MVSKREETFGVSKKDKLASKLPKTFAHYEAINGVVRSVENSKQAKEQQKIVKHT